MENYNIINILTYQLHELEHLIKKDVKRGNMIYNYYINEEECELLDHNKLQTYLSETKIENLAALKNLNNLCIKINNLWNDDLKTLNPKKLDNPFIIKEEESKSGWWINSITDFYAIHLTEVKFHYLTFEGDKKSFMIRCRDNSTLKHYTLERINSKCRNIRNLLVKFYPVLRQEEDPKQGLIQYKNFKKLEFSPRPYNEYEFETMKNVFDKHLKDCKYIFLSLEKKEKQEFKTHIINNLNDVKNKQVLPEFKTLLSEIILMSNDDFEKPQQTSNSKQEKGFKKFKWFKIGLKFATCEVQDLYKKYKNDKGHFKKITLELGFKETDRPFISETINNSTDSNNNIYRNLNKMQKILTYCTDNKISVCEDFQRTINLLQQN